MTSADTMRTPTGLAVASRLLGLVLVAAVLACCSILPGFPQPVGALVTVSTRGGECPAGTCESQTVIERDGRVHATKPVPREIGRLNEATRAALDAAIRATDFAAIRSRPFTGECPTAFDGQELIYEFSTSSGVQRIASCEVDIDPHHPLFSTVHNALAIDT